ncbi:hypothetical protein [Nocardiopsis deserti]|uniref:hypothetical protein n=1 Tax=Nocardiopsis deserti TaxID=2605988 RepID=UPI00123A06C6|nr:hypothetical protein [Nocardiopsis deserti]
MPEPYTPDDVVLLASRTRPPLTPDRAAPIAAVLNGILSVTSALRHVDLGETPPAFVHNKE